MSTLRPVIFDRGASPPEAWESFLAAHPVWQRHDTIRSQLVDLVRARHPCKDDLPLDECEPHIQALLQDRDPDHYGRWVYFPWSGLLVHVLPPDAFRELRADRNRFKATPAEMEAMRTATVGIVGLSVGNVIAVTLAQEGCAGRLKLADLDHIELSNLNRIRGGVQHLGVSKAHLAARQIYELNPYADLEIFDEGLTDENLDTFLDGLDVLVDECDGIRMKFRLRERARARGLPVLMETSDRGMLDIERFDEEPERLLFHGLVGEIGADELAHVDSERKAVLMMRIIGADTVSARAAASLMEIDRSISAWPQLASDVTLGGATVAKAVRRIVLGLPLPSGRTYVDLDAHLDSMPPPQPPPGANRPSSLPAPGWTQGERVTDGIPPLIREVVQAATLAPSGGNCQPWAFRYDGESLWVLHDAVRSHNQLDGRRHASMLAIGAALENLCITAEVHSHKALIERFPLEGRPEVVARVRLEPSIEPGPAARRRHQAIAKRMTNRKHGRPSPLAGRELMMLMDAARARGALLEVSVNASARNEVGSILGTGDRIRFLCEALHRDLMGEVRFTPAGTTSPDGIDLAQLEMTEFQRSAIQVVSRTDVVRLARRPGRGRALEESSQDAVAASSAVALLSFEGEGPEAWMRAGAAVQRVWLAATSAGLAMHPMTALLYMFEVAEDQPGIYTDWEREELATLHDRLFNVFTTARNHTPAFLFRLAHADEASARSGRLPVEQVLGWGGPDDV